MNRIQDNLVEYGERIKKIRRELAVSQKDFAAKLNIAASFLSEIESGKTKPGYNFLVKLASEFDVNPAWILLGTEPMFIKETPSIDQDEFGIHTESIKELLWYFKHSPLVRLSVMAFASKFLLDNEAIIRKDIQMNDPNKEK